MEKISKTISSHLKYYILEIKEKQVYWESSEHRHDRYFFELSNMLENNLDIDINNIQTKLRLSR